MSTEERRERRARRQPDAEQGDKPIKEESFDITQVNFEADLKIDPDNLDLEWMNQPILLMRYSSLESEAKQQADKAKEYVGVVRAEIANAIRKDPKSYEVEKATNDTVKELVEVQPEVREAEQKKNEAFHLLNLLGNAVRAIETRKYALENLVKLFGMEYFASPNDTRTLGEKAKDVDFNRLKDTSMTERIKKAMRKGE